MTRLAVRTFSSSPHPDRLSFADVTTTEGRSWVSVSPVAAKRSPRLHARELRQAGDSRGAHRVLLAAGACLSRDEADLTELLLAMLGTDEFKGPRERLEAMADILWAAPTGKSKAAFSILLTACAREAARVSDNSSVKRDVILATARSIWLEMTERGYVGPPDPRAAALMYRVCGDCRDLQLAREVRAQTRDPALSLSETDGNESTETATAAYILCLGRCGRSYEAELLYFSSHMAKHRSSDKVLSALFQAHLASNKISRAESLIAMHGSSFLNVQSCNAFVKQCALLRLHETSLTFVDRMARSDETGFPRPNAGTYNLLLKGLSAGTGTEDREVAADRALLVVEDMKRLGIAPTTVTYNTVIRSLVFRNQVNNAMELYEKMDSPNRITFSHLMQGAANTGDVNLARKVLNELKQAGERPNYGFCKSLLEVVARVEGVEAAFDQAKVISQQFADVLVFGDVGGQEAVRMALISACGKIKDLPRAFAALRAKLNDRNDSAGSLAPLYVATVLMQVCLDCGAPGQALEVFSSVKAAGVPPNFEVYESLIFGLASHVRATISAAADEDGLGRGASARSDLEVFAHGRNWSDDTQQRGHWHYSPSPHDIVRIAVELLREMHDVGAARAGRQAAYMYNTLMTAAACVGDFELALQIFNKMCRHNNPGVIYVARGEGGASTKDFVPQSKAFAGLESTLGADTSDETRDRESLSALVATGMFESSYEFPAATTGTYNAMMAAAWRNGEPLFAFQVFDTMQIDRINEPNAATLALLADIALTEDAIPIEAQETLLTCLDRCTHVPPSLASNRVRLRQKLLALRWS